MRALSHARRRDGRGSAQQIRPGPRRLHPSPLAPPPGRAEQIGERHQITVTHDPGKVVLVLPGADAEPRSNTRVISVLLPNGQSVASDWAKYRTTARPLRGPSKPTSRIARCVWGSG